MLIPSKGYPAEPETGLLPTSESDVAAIDLARECLYRFLSVCVDGPYIETWYQLENEENLRLAREAAAVIREEAEAAAPVELSPGERPPQELDLDPLVEAMRRPLDELRAEFDRAFGLVVAKECPPYETEYHLSSETFFRSQELADIAGFYRAFGLEPGGFRPERPDHLALELEYMAFLLMKQRLAAAEPGRAERAEVCRLAQRQFLRDHLAWWVPAFSRGLERKAENGYLAALARVLAAFIPVERQHLGVETSKRPARPALIERPEEQTGCNVCPLLS